MKRLIFETPEVLIDIPLYNRVILIIGDSGSGKSFICNQISDSKSDTKLMAEVKSNWNLNDILIVRSKLEVEAIKSKHGKLIIIDRADMILSEDDIEFINTSDNQFILMYRGKLKKIKANMNSYIQLASKIIDGKVYIKGLLPCEKW